MGYDRYYNYDGNLDFEFAVWLRRLNKGIASWDQASIDRCVNKLDSYKHEKMAPVLVREYKELAEKHQLDSLIRKFDVESGQYSNSG